MIYGDSRLPERFWEKVHPEPNTGCYLWSAGRVGSMGYGKYYHEGRQRPAHVVAFTVGGGVLTEDRPRVLHACDQPLCCRWDHLSAGSQGENIHQMMARGRLVIGVKMKISATIADLIRVEYSQGGVSQKALGVRYGISESMVCHIVNRRRWNVAWQR